MGLDMYLKAERYVSNYPHASAEEKKTAVALASAVGIEGFEGTSIVIKLNVAYWRKANQIHAWFVKNVQDGKDECEESEVSVGQLRTLMEACKTILGDRSKAGELPPPQSGFFFGTTEFDQYYFSDLELTIKQIEPLITDPKWADFDFQYQSSW